MGFAQYRQELKGRIDAELEARTGEAYQIADDLADGARTGTEQEIAVLTERAQVALAAFPDNERTRMLVEAPAACVRMMAPAASGAR